MENLINRIHSIVGNVCNKKAEEEGRGFAQAAWFFENGHGQIKEELTREGFKEWFDKAIELGYTADDVLVYRAYATGYKSWYEWVKFDLEIPVYGQYSAFNAIEFPKDSELPKDFVMPFIKREEEEQAKRDAERERKRLQHEDEIAKREQQEAEEKARLEEEKKAWIAEHGSDYLKRATKLDYNCQRQYIKERVALEYPDYTVDFDEQAEWKDRACPSLTALYEVEKLIEAGVKAEVVWLTEPIGPANAGDDYYEYDWVSCEAIVITEYLGRYILVKIV